MKKQDIFNALLSPEFPLPGDEDAPYPSGTGKVPFKWEVYLLLSGGWSGSECLTLAVSQVPLIKNNQCHSSTFGV